MENTIEAIVEGCNSDDPEYLHYLDITFHIPECTQIITGKTPLILYRRFNPETVFISQIDRKNELQANYKFEDPNSPNNPDWLHWAFSMVRSVTTKDGRFYVNPIHFDRGFGYYLDNIDTIVNDCVEVFRGIRGIEDIPNRRII